MSSIRSPENLNAAWTNIFSYGFGGFGVTLSLVTMILIFIWLLSSDGGGLGLRDNTAVTTDYFNWHPLIMSIAFLLFMTPAASIFEIFSLCSRNRNKQIHGLFQSLSIICIIIGYIIIYDCHTILSTHGLALSMHSIAGYITIGLCIITYIMGVYLYVLKLGGQLRGELKPLHKRLGIMSLFMGYSTMLMGMTEKANGLNGNSLILSQVIIGLLIGTCLCIGFSIIKFINKKHSDFKYAIIPDDVDATVQLL
eukprot:427556_1